MEEGEEEVRGMRGGRERRLLSGAEIKHERGQKQVNRSSHRVRNLYMSEVSPLI